MILVVGAGGNGQTYFMNFLKNNKIKINCSSDKDGLKHLSHPIYLKKNITKCIFLYNDPLKSVYSHFRRKWQYIQLQKLGNPHKLNKNDVKNINIFFKLVIERKVDLYGIRYQFYNWKNTKLNFPIYFLDFNDVLKSKNELNNFLGVELNYDLFSYKKRTNNNYVIHNDIKKIYSDLYKYIKDEVKI